MATIAAPENIAIPEKLTSHPALPGPCTLTIFGITGDLSRRLLLPALYNLRKQRSLSDNFAMIGFASSERDEQEFRDAIAADLRKAIGPEADDSVIKWLASRVHYIGAKFEDKEGWKRLRDALHRLETEYHTEGNC